MRQVGPTPSTPALLELGRSRRMVRALPAHGRSEARFQVVAGLLGRAQRPARPAGASTAHSRCSVAPKAGRGASTGRVTLAVKGPDLGQRALAVLPRD